MTLSAAVYSTDGIDRYEDLQAAVAAPGETWIRADGAERTELSDLVGRLGIHELAVEDVTDAQPRPKVEEFDTHTFVLLQAARLSQREVAFGKEVQTHPIGLFIGEGWLLTLTPTPIEAIDAAAAEWERHSRRVANRGTDFLAYRIMDVIVDGYFELLDEIEGDIEAAEEEVLTDPDPELLEDLNDIRRDLLAFRRIAWPAREAVGQLSRGDVAAVSERNEKYFRDIYDHLVEVVDLIETYRDLTRGSRDIYLNAVSQSTNEVMRVLTVVATIFIPLTFVVGVYGMNFAGTPLSMPELEWATGYPATMLGMAVVALLMLAHFRRQGWL